MTTEKRKSPNWSIEETNTFLDFIITNDVMARFDDKKTRTADIYKELSEKMEQRGFFRDAEQLKNKFGRLKTDFIKSRNSNNTSGHDRQTGPFYSRLSTLLSKRPVLAFQEAGFDSSELPTDTEASQSTVLSESTCNGNIDEASTSTDPLLPPTPTDSGSANVETELEADESLTPKVKRNRTSYRAIVSSLTEDLTKTIEEQTQKTLDALQKMQDDDQKFMNDMQLKDQQFLLNLFAQGVEFQYVTEES